MRNYWIIPCNTNYYDVIGAFESLEKINWKQVLTEVQVGDIAYIYAGNDIKRMLYKCEIKEINLTDSYIDDKEFSINPKCYEHYNRYMTLEKIIKYDNFFNYFKYEKLKSNGLRTIRSQHRAPEELVMYLDKMELEILSKNKIDVLIDKFVENNDIEKYNKNICKLEKKRDSFVKKFNSKMISELNVEDYVIGRSTIDEKGKNSFCYLIETQFKEFGDMRGSFASKFGVWINKYGEICFTKKYGLNITEAFQNLKIQLIELLDAGEKKDFERIEKNLICPIFKGKILSMYFPKDYLCIFDKDDIEILLKELNIYYNPKEIYLLEQKKELLKKFKENNKILRNTKNSYYMKFLYETFTPKLLEIKESDEIKGEIAYYNFEEIKFKYLGEHISKKSNKPKGKFNYVKIEEQKKVVGDRGENAILNYEKDQLLEKGLVELSKKVRIVEDDSLGYDVISYDDTGKEKHIEVKTKSGLSNYLDFYLTENELNKFKTEENHYIYYVFDIKNKKPKFTVIDKSTLLENEQIYLKPVAYRVQIDVKKI